MLGDTNVNRVCKDNFEVVISKAFRAVFGQVELTAFYAWEGTLLYWLFYPIA